MDSLGPLLLLRVRTIGQRLFHRFGLHCATHQIRVILISAVVITSLFYPALTIYSSSQPRFLAHFSSQILDPFLAADAISSYDAQHHLRDIWAAHDSFHVREDSVVRARCGVEQTLRVERVLVHSSATGDSTALSHRLLRATLRLERKISDTLAARSVPCSSDPTDSCAYDRRNILHTLAPSNNVSFAGVPIESQMVLAWNDRSEYSSVDAGSTAGHALWLRILEDASKESADLITETQQPKLVALEVFYAERASVHNGIGLIFTGAIEMLVSTITSLSVCALVGFRVTMIPWGIFPLVIMFIGTENMFTLVEAVVKTSITLPWDSNSLKVLTYNVILGIIAFFARGATRQFCAFAVVVLVAHWFLVHTFFVAVLSIDLQRLELEELLQQNASFTPPIQSMAPGQPDGRYRKLLATTWTLYFVTSPAARLSDTTTIPTSIPLAQQRKQDILSGAGDPAWHTWQLLNPGEDPLVHLRIESPTLLMFRPTDATQPATYSQPSHRARPSLSYSWIMRTSARMARIVVLPIAATRRSANVAAVSIGNELVLWNDGSASPIVLGTADVLDVGPSTLSAGITALALDDVGSFCAVGGRPQRVFRGASSAVTGLRFVNTRISGRSTPVSLARPDQLPTVFATLENREIIKCDGAKSDYPVVVSAPQGRCVIWSTILFLPDTNLVPGFDPPLASECHLQAGNPADTVASFHACTVELGGVRTAIIAASTEAGVISLWDGLRICAAPSKPCARCGALPSNVFALIFAAGPVVHFFPPSTSVPPARSRHASMSEDSAPFPISGHGVLSRRASEKDSLRRAAAVDTLVVPENASDAPPGPLDPPQIPARWRSLVISQVADTTCERGAWDVAGSKVVGLRRRSRKPPDSGTSGVEMVNAGSLSTHTQRDCGLSAASLERWEAWTASPLAALEHAVPPALAARPAVTREKPRLPFTRVRPS
ncbi:sterol-sensing domain of SREBP cleavage-activation-domain-containing protein [Russula vinacea]|nr:sterol-sensing domain of SREBP cleavage-activation-domain-containing protein [Russula vinacea]